MSSGAVGALCQVQLVSALNLWLDVDPECSFFQQEYCRHSPFAIAEIDCYAQSSQDWGRPLIFETPRLGDLLSALFLKLQVEGLRLAASVDPPITLAAGTNATIAWVPSMGHAAIREAKLEVGQVPADSITGTLLEILEQHRAVAGNEQGAAIGSFDDAADLREWSYYAQTLHIALPFFFFEHPEVYLPIIALSQHPVRVKIYLREKAALINANDDNDNCIDGTNAALLQDGYTGALVDATLVARMVFLDQFERNLISAEPHEIVMIQHQEEHTEVILAGTSTKKTTLSFNNAVLALFSWYEMDRATATTVEGSVNCNKDWFNFSVPHPQQPIWFAAGVTPIQVMPFDTWQLKFNGSDRVAQREASYFVHCTPFLHANKKTKGLNVLYYAFHMKPISDYQTPAGHANFSRLHEVSSHVTFKMVGGVTILTALNPNDIENTVGDGVWKHACMSYNVLRISMGQCLLKFH